MITLLAVLIPFCILAGCAGQEAQSPTEPTEQVLIVHGMLRAEADSQEILVEHARSVEEGFFRRLTPASGATVTVAGPGASHVFAEDAGQPGVYRASFRPRGGQSYTLEVRVPAGPVVTGETLVPGEIRLAVPSRDTVIDARDTAPVVFHWTRAPMAAGYLLTSRRLDRPPGFNDLGGGGAGQDTTVAVDVVLESLLSGAPRQLQYAAAAVDANYRRYVAAADTGDRDFVRTTVRGGYGLFGSYALSNPLVVEIR